MFTSFNKAFDKKKSIDNIPEPIIKALNEKLPEGFKYVPVDNETCFLVPEGEKANISFAFSKDNEFNAKTPDELMDYLYRTQKQLEIKDNKIKINGTNFSAKDLIKVPLKDVEVLDDKQSITIRPPEFPKPFDLPIGYGCEEYMNFKIQRQPLADLKKSLFKSIDNDYIEVSYIIDEINRRMSMDFKIRFDKAKTIEEILIACKMYNVFKSGKIIIGNDTMNVCINEKDDDTFVDLIEFWEKVGELSKFLNIEFKPQPIVYTKDVKIVNALYNSFIKNTDFEEFINTEKFTLTFKDKMENDKISYKDEMALQIVDYREYFILEKSLKLYCLTTLSNFKIKEILENNAELFKYDMVVDALTEEGVMKKIRFFENEKDVELYREKINNN